MTQQTLGIISLNVKDDILNKISTTLKVKIVYEQQFDLTAATSLEVLDKTISKTLPVYGFILEGSNAIRDWSQITSSTASLSKRRGTFVHASTVENAQHQVGWFKNLVLNDLSVEKNTSTTSSTSSSSIPIKVKKQQKPKSVNVSDNSSQRKPVRSGTTAQQQSPPSRPLATAARKPAVSTSNRSKIPNANVKAKPVTTRPTSAIATAAKVKTPATSSVTPTKRVNDGMKPASGRRGSLVASTLAASSSKRLLSTTSKGGVIKNTPPVSVLTGRTRKPSRLTEKRPVLVAASAAPEKIDSVKEEEQTEEIKPEIQQEALSSPSTPTPTTTTTRPFEEAVEHAEAQEAPSDTAMIQEQHIVSYPSTCSSAATDEHDAEVAATTSKKDMMIASSTQTSAINTSSVPLLCNSGRSSFSPTSIASLPRPETPEVDQLRLRFETIIQTSTPVGNTQDVVARRPSSKLSQYELASRIKEMKPRGPVGSRVKSMVELFMDENLNKWEF
ncbi:uncharacterized protein ATC70_010037 [Mucor velutinosus]|uniref:Uncharacterized protein n=1 Tax=Mucor velutinosus TaxID=708070 RepID=A0AAN7DRT9_9FUNG|nr:hypothetical protein ATC70_010037 [Mucor velutinosus]